MNMDIIYWDSDCFISIFNEDADRITILNNIIADAENEKIKIATSALTLAEAYKTKGPEPKLKAVPLSVRKQIGGFFQNPYISVRNITRLTAELARSLMWDHNIAHKDAIHIATAIENKIPLFNTYDNGLISKGTELGNKYDLKIESPQLFIDSKSKASFQRELILEEAKN